MSSKNEPDSTSTECPFDAFPPPIAVDPDTDGHLRNLLFGSA